MPTTPWRNGAVHYELDRTEGNGSGQQTPLVLVHGTGGDAEAVFGHVVGPLVEHRDVIRPNLSGSGRTGDTGGELTVDTFAEQVAAATRAASPNQPADLLGFSLGAVAAAATAATNPELVRRLILVAGWAHTTDPRDRLYFETWERLFETDRDLFKRFTALTGYSAAAVDGFGHDGISQYLGNEWPPPSMGRQITAGLRVDIRALLPQIQAPTLVIGLGADAMVPVEGSRQLHAGIPDSRLVEINGEGHMDWFIQPDRLLTQVQAFLDT
ncbi:alpha/beta hydrolase [Phytoactinopolyspora alkaliphila]|uniref:Alpha/beta hydrolase n=1 Tax=Phytoactinopolyspora alkaliphila TaxID=1783498 RepID=A0A6N9YJ11_9ACTN|nr:alpha/beta hydrolase [Phytoactinopolyspora alkaliphila]NED94910.1 alpha/beta hydrolase [Phytoactinopolyspora alkaliphila]